MRDSLKHLIAVMRRDLLSLTGLAILRLGGPFLTFLVSLVVARQMDIEEYGRFTFALAIFSLFLPLFSLGMDQILIKAFATRYNTRLPLVEACSWVQLCVSLVICFGAPLTAYVISGSVESMLVTAACCVSYIVRAFTCYEKRLMAHNQFTSVGIVSGIALLAAAAYAVVAAQFANVYLMPITFSVYFGLQAIMYRHIAVGDTLPLRNAALVRKVARCLVHISGPMFLSGIAVSLYMRLDVIMLLPLCGTSETALYGAASRMTQLLLIIPNLLPELVFPRLLRQNTIGAWAVALRCQFLLSVVMTIAGVIILPTVLAALFGEKYVQSGFYFQLQSLAIPFVCQGAIMTRVLVAENRRYDVLYISLSALLLAVTLNVLLVPTFRGPGAAIVMMATQFWATTGVYLIVPCFSKNREVLSMAFGLSGRSILSSEVTTEAAAKDVKIKTIPIS